MKVPVRWGDIPLFQLKPTFQKTTNRRSCPTRLACKICRTDFVYFPIQNPNLIVQANRRHVKYTAKAPCPKIRSRLPMKNRPGNGEFRNGTKRQETTETPLFIRQWGTTDGGMKSLGIAGYFPVQLPQTWCVVECLNNHLNPNVLYRVLAVRCLFFLSFFFQFAASFRSAVRWDRHTLWQALVGVLACGAWQCVWLWSVGYWCCLIFFDR